MQWLDIVVLLNLQDSLADLTDGSHLCSDALRLSQSQVVSRNDPLKESSVDNQYQCGSLYFRFFIS